MPPKQSWKAKALAWQAKAAPVLRRPAAAPLKAAAPPPVPKVKAGAGVVVPGGMLGMAGMGAPPPAVPKLGRGAPARAAAAALLAGQQAGQAGPAMP